MPHSVTWEWIGADGQPKSKPIPGEKFDTYEQARARADELKAESESLGSPNRYGIAETPPDPEPGSDEWYRERARQRYAEDSDDDVEIDENATISRAEAGAFVQAWVWVPAPWIDEDEEEEDDLGDPFLDGPDDSGACR